MKDIKNVSIVMCTYNGAKYLEEQLESIVNQTYPIYELIIQDDCSLDDTFQIACEYAKKYSFIHVYQNEKQKGVNQNFYSAMRRAVGDFIAVTDQDDIWVPQKIEWQVQTIGDAWLSAGITKPFIEESDIKAKAYFDSRIPNICLERMMYSAMIAGHTMMIKREFLEKLFLLEDWIEYYMYDHFIQIVAGAYEKISYVHKVLVHQRKHIESATYTAPLNYERSIRNIYNSACRTYRQYQTIRPKMEKYFEHTYELLRSIPVENSSLRNGMKLALYQKDLSFWNFICLVLLCVSLRNKIFYSLLKKYILFSIESYIFSCFL